MENEKNDEELVIFEDLDNTNNVEKVVNVERLVNKLKMIRSMYKEYGFDTDKILHNCELRGIKNDN